MKLLLDPYAKDPYGKASRIAMTEYANTIAEINPALAKAIYSTLAEIYATLPVAKVEFEDK